VDHALRRFLASEEQRANREAQKRRTAAERTRGMLADGSRRRATDVLIAERRAEAQAEDREDADRRHRSVPGGQLRRDAGGTRRSIRP
jgi:hypothetical protein